MTPSPLIFCTPDFLEKLVKAFPLGKINSFSHNIGDCQQKIAALDSQPERVVHILFKGTEAQSLNQAVKDHLNLSRENPLIGPVDLNKGPRFPDMSSVYESNEGIIVVVGEDVDLNKFEEPWASVSGGVWEAIALKHRGYKIHAWLIADLEKWISDAS